MNPYSIFSSEQIREFLREKGEELNDKETDYELSIRIAGLAIFYWNDSMKETHKQFMIDFYSAFEENPETGKIKLDEMSIAELEKLFRISKMSAREYCSLYIHINTGTPYQFYEWEEIEKIFEQRKGNLREFLCSKILEFKKKDEKPMFSLSSSDKKSTSQE